MVFKAKQPYTVRFGLVLLLDFYINDTYIDHVLKLCNTKYIDHYYISMAHSWLISICYIKYPEKTKQFLENSKYVLGYIEKQFLRYVIQDVFQKKRKKC